jgi:hypothetical protein
MAEYRNFKKPFMPKPRYPRVKGCYCNYIEQTGMVSYKDIPFSFYDVFLPEYPEFFTHYQEN